MSSKTLIIYDDKCLFCIDIKKKIDKIDKNKKLKWVGITKFNYKKHNLRKQDLLEEMHLIVDNKVYKGYYAFKQISKRIPLLFLLYIMMLIPGIDIIGNWVYKLVAKNRYNIQS